MVNKIHIMQDYVMKEFSERRKKTIPPEEIAKARFKNFLGGILIGLAIGVLLLIISNSH